MKPIAHNISRLREAFGLTQQQVADWLGINRAALAMYETDARSPSLGHLDKLATLYAVEVSDLIRPDLEVPPLIAGLRQVGPFTQKAVEGLASFFRIVRNYERMRRLLEAG